MISLTDFLRQIAAIIALCPAYLLGHDGTDGYCDCVGLIVGAVRRAGIKYDGIHGSNYLARRHMKAAPVAIKSKADLQYGDIVFKARKPADDRYALPARYRKGGSLYNGDLTDFYHVGVVTSISPLRISHMTTPRPKEDTSLGRWAYRGRLDYVAEDAILEPVLDPETEPIIPPVIGSQDSAIIAPVVPIGADFTAGDAVLIAPSGRTVNFRRRGSLKSRLIDRIPIGTHVEVLEYGGGVWAKVHYRRSTGYIMAKFLGTEV